MTTAISASSTANDDGRDIGAMSAPVPWKPDMASIRPLSPRQSLAVIGERLLTVVSVSSKSGVAV
jgi:hypothetical protein